MDERRKLGEEANIAEEGGADHDLVKRHGPERRPPPPDSPAHPCACRQEPKRNREHPLPVGREHVDRSSQALEPSGPVRGAEPERFGLEPDSELAKDELCPRARVSKEPGEPLPVAVEIQGELSRIVKVDPIAARPADDAVRPERPVGALAVREREVERAVVRDENEAGDRFG